MAIEKGGNSLPVVIISAIVIVMPKYTLLHKCNRTQIQFVLRMTPVSSFELQIFNTWSSMSPAGRDCLDLRECHAASAQKFWESVASASAMCSPPRHLATEP
eukprot:5492606-Amphidinium_carterae.1